jgi:5,5'-dehydrodivanillate O-demethylase oxygenase subunit
MAGRGTLKLADLEAVGPGSPAGRYLRLFWQPVLRARDLLPGRAKPLEILSEKFTVYRGATGLAHIADFRCPHRKTQLSLGWVEGDSLRCRYHGWRFDGDGQCVEQPNEDRPFSEKVRLRSYPTREYAGLIFAYFGDGEPPAFPTYPDLDRPGVLIDDPVEILPCNYWNRFDNDHGHRAWVHRATALRHNRKDILVIRHETVEECEYGWRGTRAVSGEKGDAKTSLGIVKGEKDTAQDFLKMARYKHWIMPNVRMWFQRTRAKGFEGREFWETKAVWTVPVNDQKLASFDVTLTPLEGEEARVYEQSRRQQQESEAETRWDLAEKILAGEMTLEDLPDDMGAYTSFTIEDYVTQVGQGPLAGRGEETLAVSDGRVLLTRRLWLREVGALLAGEPLTQWKIPSESFTSAPMRSDRRASSI